MNLGEIQLDDMNKKNYAEFLKVQDDGHIWWPLQDAIRLGAGFVPACDDHWQLEPQLQAPNQRAIANERTLMGALGDARLTIPKPMIFERDGFRYVDAAGFVEWLSQYICQTQAEIVFPNALAKQIQMALAKAAAERPPQALASFDSLTLALEGTFDKQLAALPEDLRQRVEQALLMPWDNLSREQRRSVVEQWDYQHDPSTEQERQYWWDFFLKKDALENQIAEWEKSATPTSTDLAHKEAKIKELLNKLRLMEQEERKPQPPYIPGKMQYASAAVAQAPTKYIAYPKAMQYLAIQLKATPEELAAWIFFGTEQGGLAAYTNANELDPPPQFFYGYYIGVENYTAPLMACWFKEEDIESFQPTERYITGKELIERWGKQSGIQPAAFIHAKIGESRLMDSHPTFGGTKATFSEKEEFPPLETGLFAMSRIRAIEEEDFGTMVSATRESATDSRHNEKPWLNSNPADPDPAYPWYPAARYFARELIRDDATLLTKRDLLARKVANALQRAGILKRGGKQPLDPATVKKAFIKVVLG